MVVSLCFTILVPSLRAVSPPNPRQRSSHKGPNFRTAEYLPKEALRQKAGRRPCPPSSSSLRSPRGRGAAHPLHHTPSPMQDVLCTVLRSLRLYITSCVIDSHPPTEEPGLRILARDIWRADRGI